MKKKAYDIKLKILALITANVFLVSCFTGIVGAADFNKNITSTSCLAPSISMSDGSLRNGLLKINPQNPGSLSALSTERTILEGPILMATLGPASRGKELELVENGINLFRVPLGHGTRESHQETIDLIDKINIEHDKDVGIMMDKTKYMGLVVSKDAKLDVNQRYETGELEFYMTIKSSASVIQESAGVAYYS